MTHRLLSCGALLALLALGAQASAADAYSHRTLPTLAALREPRLPDPRAVPDDADRLPPDSTSSDLLFWTVSDSITALVGVGEEGMHHFDEEDEWLRAPFGDNLLTPPEEWQPTFGEEAMGGLRVDYNRVDNLRVGLAGELQEPRTMNPRLGGRIDYSFGRKRTLYGVQLEQPLLPPGRLAVGVSMVRSTDHNDLQQVEDLENSLALLLARQDYRDYFEREGYGAYLSWRVPDFSTVSVHFRNDEYRTLPLDRGTRSWFFRDIDLRENPVVNDGNAHRALLRFERMTQRTKRMRTGLYHWIEFEQAGGGLKGDFTYRRALADVRSVVRLSPSNSLALRGVFGTGMSGELPLQRQFPLGGVDGLRAHAFAQYQGNQIALAQFEYVIGPWGWRWDMFEAGLHVLAFVDVGSAWNNPHHQWDIGRQHVQADGGFGLSTSDDNLRFYFAKNLQDTDSEFVFQLRLQRPF